MSRPVPAITITPPTLFSWATAANYPSGPYTGQPLKLAPAGSFYSPNTKPPAQGFNYVFNQFGAADLLLSNYVAATGRAVLDWSGNAPALNWLPKRPFSEILTVLGGGASIYTGFHAMTFGVPLGVPKWLALVSYTTGGGTNKVSLAETWGTDPGDWTIFSPDIVSTGLALGTGGVLPMALVCDPTSDNLVYAAVVNSAGTGFNVFKIDLQAATVTSVLATISFGAGLCSSVTLHVLPWNGTIIAAATETTGAHSAIWTSTNQGATWSTPNQAGTLGQAVQKYYFANVLVGATNYVAMLVAGTANAFYGYSADGVTWTTTTSSFGTAPAQGLAVGNDPSGNLVKFCANGRIYAWNPTGGPPVAEYVFHAGNYVEDLSASGNLLVGISHSSPARVVFSVDGGVAWRFTQFPVAGSTILPTLASSRVYGLAIGSGVGEATQFAYFTDTECRFSASAGLPLPAAATGTPYAPVL